MHVIEEYYNLNCEKENCRLSNDSAEFLITHSLVCKYINGGNTVIDLGGATGVYSIPLSKKGCEVTVVDLSRKELEIAKRKAIKDKLDINFIHGNALDFNSSKKYDILLCLGPLYHCRSEEEITLMIEKCISLLKPGGIGFLAFISVFASYNHFINNLDSYCEQEIPDIINSFKTRIQINLPFIFEKRDSLPINFVFPDRLPRFLANFNIEILDLLSVDIIHPNRFNNFNEKLFKLLYILGSNYMINYGEHLLVSFRKNKE